MEYAPTSRFENTGGAVEPAFFLHTGAGNPLAGQDAGNNAKPAPGDLDGDGDLDLVTGASDGTFDVHYLPEPARFLLIGLVARSLPPPSLNRAASP